MSELDEGMSRVDEEMSETLEERLRRHAKDDPNSMFKAYPDDLLELLDKRDSLLQHVEDGFSICESNYRKLSSKNEEMWEILVTAQHNNDRTNGGAWRINSIFDRKITDVLANNIKEK